jgi:hypothetical protein
MDDSSLRPLYVLPLRTLWLNVFIPWSPRKYIIAVAWSPDQRQSLGSSQTRLLHPSPGMFMHVLKIPAGVCMFSATPFNVNFL